MKYVLGIIIVLSTFAFVPQSAQAATKTCTPIFGGGSKCISPDPTTASKQTKPTPTPTKRPTQVANGTQTTKGGQVVHTPTPTKKTPATGPETLALAVLPAAAAVGVYLRRKSNLK